MTNSRSIHGWLVIDKPLHITSAQVVHLVKKKLKGVKIGHGGTLDPLATGILPLALGEATKTVSYIMHGRKKYRFEVTWGEQRTTDDREGEVLASSPTRPTKEEILAILPQFQGVISQAPPLYSALKIKGQRACDLMRQQHTVELASRPVEIFSLSLQEFISPEHAIFEVDCGKGTYVRALARDMGERLKCYGYASSIDRLAVGVFKKIQALSLEKLASLEENVILRDYLQGIPDVLDDIPAVQLTDTQVKYLKLGQGIAYESLGAPIKPGTILLALDAFHNPVAFVRWRDYKLWPERVFNI